MTAGPAARAAGPFLREAGRKPAGAGFPDLWRGTAMLMPPLRLQMLLSPQTPLELALRACAGSVGLVFAYGCSYNLLLLVPSIYLLQIYDRVLSSRSVDT